MKSLSVSYTQHVLLFSVSPTVTHLLPLSMFAYLSLSAAILILLAGQVACEKSVKKTLDPVLNKYFADPSLIQVGNTWYSFATCAAGKNIQVATSKDFKEWTLLDHDPLPDTGSWVNHTHFEGGGVAPDVQRIVRISLHYFPNTLADCSICRRMDRL
jgi:hypothetical protein